MIAHSFTVIVLPFFLLLQLACECVGWSWSHSWTQQTHRYAMPSTSKSELWAKRPTGKKSSLPLSGMPMSPQILLFETDDDDGEGDDNNVIVIRYMYDGGTISNGKICLLTPENENHVSSSEILAVLQRDGVDMDRFYASVYESEISGGGWLSIDMNSNGDDNDIHINNNKSKELLLPIPPRQSSLDHEEEEDYPSVSTYTSPTYVPSRRIDVKLFRRPEIDDSGKITTVDDFDALLAEAASKPCGKLPSSSLGYFGIGIINGKTEDNVGTLMRSAYQLGASFIYTIGKRYKIQSADTVKSHVRIPLFELDDWEAFAKFAPRHTKLVAVEMGGTPLDKFQHPQNAVYVLGSEDAGVPKSVVRACHEVVSLDCDRYASYNVAVAGSIIMYDRMQKAKMKHATRN